LAVWLLAAALISAASYAVWRTTVPRADPRLDQLWDLVQQSKDASEPVIGLDEVARILGNGDDFSGSAACIINPYAEVKRPFVVAGENVDRYLGHEADETVFNFLVVRPRSQASARAVQQFIVGYGSLRVRISDASQYWCGCSDAKGAVESRRRERADRRSRDSGGERPAEPALWRAVIAA
jgi:hypothetical protein